jgi:glycosyltransferase involved in cell wall biosynthesis
VPVVASAVGGHLDTVIDGVTGLHVPPRVPGALAGRLRRLLTDPRLGRSFGAAAAAHARDRYPWSRIAAETEAVYHRVVGPPQEEIVMADGARS